MLAAEAAVLWQDLISGSMAVPCSNKHVVSVKKQSALEARPAWQNQAVSSGTIDEKIYQRQLQKGGLAAMMHDEEAKGPAKKGPAIASFTREELRELFRLNLETDCDTRTLVQGTPAGSDWETGADVSMHGPLRAAVATGVVSYVYQGPCKDPGASARVDVSKPVATQEEPSAAGSAADNMTSSQAHISSLAASQRRRLALAPKDSNIVQGSESSHAAAKAAPRAACHDLHGCEDDDIGCLDSDLG